MSPRLASRITGTPGWWAWTCATSRSSAASAPSAAKWAICGLNAQACAAVASTMSRQNAKTASGSPANRAGNRPGSGSRPTQTREPVDAQRCRNACMKAIAGPLLQRLEAQALRTGVVAHAPLLVFLVLAVVALEELHVRVALEGEDVGRDAVQEPAVVADHEGVAGEFQQRVLERAQGLHVEVVGRLVEQQHVAALQQGLGHVQAAALAAGQGADPLLLVLALEVEAADVGARLDLDAVDVEDVEAGVDPLEHGLVACQRVAALVDVGQVHGRADHDLAGVGLFLAGDHLEERGLAGAVGADDAADRARRHDEAQVVDEQAVAEALGDVLELDHRVAQALARRDEDLVGLVALLVLDRLQLLQARQARLALGAAALGVLPRPLQLLLDRLLAGLLLRLLALEAVFLLHQPLGVVALPRDAAAAVELEDPLGGVVEEVAVMGHRHHGARVALQELLQPLHRLGVEVVGGLVQQ